MNAQRIWRCWIAIASVWVWAASSAASQQVETVNCFVALVNGRLITLMDVKIAESLRFFETDAKADARERRREILEKLIDQKVAIEFALERTPLEAAKVDEARNELLARLGREEARRRLAEFGLEGPDLLPYLEEKVLSETIIANRFGRSVSVSLKEIEVYYDEVYAPALKKLGAEVKPLVEVLNVLEAEIKKSKIEGPASLWIKNLRQQSEIEIRADCLNK
ncbi:MAG: hypothetical protein Q8O91_10420 [Candidatus Aminicenantes bacterium]|nr:hypothetical protein [Candidatus Aminicenantes bacterium]